MKKPTTIYVVTAGDYSDYHIVGMFDSREKAEEYVNHSTDSDLNDIEEYNLNEPKPDNSEKVFTLRSEFDVIDFEVIGYKAAPNHCKDLMCRVGDSGRGSFDAVVFYVCADTRERAIKIASERFRQVKAEEHLRYPLLRRSICVKYDGYKQLIYPFVHYHTGEVVLPSNCTLLSYTVPKDLEPHVKVITMEELVARYKKEETDNE